MRISDWSSDVCSSDLIDGPVNYLGSLYRAVPIAITVEGANILTRWLIIFGQGAIRAHPYLMREENGSASSRERVCPSVYIAVAAVSLRKKKHAVKGEGITEVLLLTGSIDIVRK